MGTAPANPLRHYPETLMSRDKKPDGADGNIKQ